MALVEMASKLIQTIAQTPQEKYFPQLLNFTLQINRGGFLPLGNPPSSICVPSQSFYQKETSLPLSKQWADLTSSPGFSNWCKNEISIPSQLFFKQELSKISLFFVLFCFFSNWCPCHQKKIHVQWEQMRLRQKEAERRDRVKSTKWCSRPCFLL